MATTLAATKKPIVEDEDSAAMPHAFVGVQPVDVADALARVAGQLLREPAALSDPLRRALQELAAVTLGVSQRAPQPGDKRFEHWGWHRSPLHRRLMQSYLAITSLLEEAVERADLDPRARKRARFALDMVVEALAPTNNFWLNPAAVERAVRTAGRSVAVGAARAARDVLTQSGLPVLADPTAFRVGETLAATPGSVVMRTEVLELIQYLPSTARVQAEPLVIVPSPVNKYYLLDLAPGKSLVEYSLARGLQVFAVSWRNPNPDHRDWGLNTYVTALREAVEAATEIASSPAHLVSVCAGGIISAVLLDHLAATGGADLVRTLTLAVSAVDTSHPTTFGAFSTARSIERDLRRWSQRGIVPASHIHRVFAWARPRDLLWLPRVNYYLLGLDLPANEISSWNMDKTNLPARLHADFAQILARNLMATPGGLEVLGRAVDLRTVRQEVYDLAAGADHIVPWQACHKSASAFGGEVTFVLASGGHVQSLVNPPGHPRSRYWTNPDRAGSPEEWLAGAEEHTGTWWDHWLAWIGARAGATRAAPRRLGGKGRPEMEAAPGLYVHEVP